MWYLLERRWYQVCLFGLIFILLGLAGLMRLNLMLESDISTQNVVIAVVDTSLDLASIEPVFADSIVGGYDYMDDVSIVTDVNGHGTEVVSAMLQTIDAYNIANDVDVSVQIKPYSVGVDQIDLLAMHSSLCDNVE